LSIEIVDIRSEALDGSWLDILDVTAEHFRHEIVDIVQVPNVTAEDFGLDSLPLHGVLEITAKLAGRRRSRGRSTRRGRCRPSNRSCYRPRRGSRRSSSRGSGRRSPSSSGPCHRPRGSPSRCPSRRRRRRASAATRRRRRRPVLPGYDGRMELVFLVFEVATLTPRSSSSSCSSRSRRRTGANNRSWSRSRGRGSCGGSCCTTYTTSRCATSRAGSFAFAFALAFTLTLPLAAFSFSSSLAFAFALGLARFELAAAELGIGWESSRELGILSGIALYQVRTTRYSAILGITGFNGSLWQGGSVSAVVKLLVG